MSVYCYHYAKVGQGEGSRNSSTTKVLRSLSSMNDYMPVVVASNLVENEGNAESTIMVVCYRMHV